jgi:3',5'-cyclic AMP phosphodiesterase CpdA
VSADRQLVAATAAIDEALEWGAQHLVVKGDLCDESYDWIWDQAAQVLVDLPVPVSIIPGNHDTGALRRFEPEVGAARRGLHVTRGVEHVDVPGLRIVLMDSTRPGNGWGSVARHGEQVAQLCAEAPGGVFVATHHHAQRFSVPLFWPHGIPGGDARSFATEVAAASSRVLVSSGHTHRCRRREVHGVTWSEVAATSHFPGVWAGYVVHEGGIRQTVRRIAAPEVMQWTEHTRSAFGGVWALWSAGELSDRSFSLDWS